MVPLPNCGLFTAFRCQKNSHCNLRGMVKKHQWLLYKKFIATGVYYYHFK